MNGLIAYLTLVTLTLHAQEKLPTGGQAQITCTAVYVSPDTALTAGHCVTHIIENKLWVKTGDGHAYPASVIGQLTRTDLALLQIKNSPPHAYASLGSPVSKGQPIYLLSSEDDMPGTYAQGIVENVILERESNTPMIMHSASILSGASGSGLFDQQGRLLGINTLSYQGLSFAVDLGPVSRFLADIQQRRALSL